MVWKSRRLKEKKRERFDKIKNKLKSAVSTIKNSPSNTEKVKNIHHFFDILINNPDYLYNDTRLNIISLYKLHEFESNGFDKKKYIKAFQSKKDNQNIKECAICLEEFDNMPESDNPHGKFTLVCNHSFCLNCIYKTIMYKSKCPMCRKRINEYL